LKKRYAILPDPLGEDAYKLQAISATPESEDKTKNNQPFSQATKNME